MSSREDPNDLRPPWWQVQSRQAARSAAKRSSSRDPVTPERIADAALAIIDRDGLAGLTVRALAQELGLGTMTLYWYVRNKEEVLDLVADRLLADTQVTPVVGDWREQCRQSMVEARGAFLAHPRAVPLIVGRGSFGPNGLRWIDRALAVFRAAGFTDTDAADCYFAAANYVAGFCTQETAGSDPTSLVNTDRADFAARARQYISLLPADRYPNVVALAAHIFSSSRDERFRFGMEALIAGFEARLDAGKRVEAPRQ